MILTVSIVQEISSATFLFLCLTSEQQKRSSGKMKLIRIRFIDKIIFPHCLLIMIKQDLKLINKKENFTLFKNDLAVIYL